MNCYEWAFTLNYRKEAVFALERQGENRSLTGGGGGGGGGRTGAGGRPPGLSGNRQTGGNENQWGSASGP